MNLKFTHVTILLTGYPYFFANIAPPLPPVIAIEARGEPNEGEMFDLWCNITVPDNATVRDIALRWENPSGTVIRSTTTSTNLAITFQRLSEDDKGFYTCTTSVRIYGFEQPLTANASMEIVVNSKPEL